MLQSWMTQIGAGIVVLVCLYAIVVGSWRERLGGVLYLAAYALSLAFGTIASEHSTLYLLVSDMVCLQGFVVLGWKSPARWPWWAVAAQVVSVTLEILTLLHAGLNNWTFLLAEALAGYAVLLALLMGAIAANRSRRRAGNEGG